MKGVVLIAVLGVGGAIAAPRCKTASDCLDQGLRLELGRARDDVGAGKAYARACKLGAGMGCTMLSKLQEKGERVNSLARAAEIFRRECEGGDALGCFQLGYAVQGDKPAAEAAHRRAAELFAVGCAAGQAKECDMQAKVLRDGKILKADEAAADAADARSLPGRTSACEANDLDACVDLAIHYRDGKGVDRDLTRSRLLFERSCATRPSDCMHVAQHYYRGTGGVAEDGARAAELFARACDARNIFACEFLEMACQNKDFPSCKREEDDP